MKNIVIMIISICISINITFSNTIKKVNNSIYGAAQMTGLDYYEYNDEYSNLDQQTGFLWGGRLGGTITLSNIYLNLDMYSTIGRTQYKGGILSNPNRKLYYQSNNVINNIDTKIGYTFYIGDNLALTPFGMFGYRFWNRMVDQHVREAYKTMYGSGGLLFQYAFLKAFVLSLSGSVGSTIAPKATSYRSDNTYNQGISEIYEVSINLNYFITQNLSILSGIEGIYFEYKKSNTVNGADEPDSKTRQINVYLGLSYSF